MDKQSILKFFNDNTKDVPQGSIYIQYGNNYTTNDICIADNINITCAEKCQIYALIKQLENKNKKPL
ncbi:hypothetical protein FXB90_00120 [Aggregatibacter actinomycetemcomitans]|nr:hypothetical protein FXB90_00120 [Aggregatibacter actinomycetemcomitans]